MAGQSKDLQSSEEIITSHFQLSIWVFETKLNCHLGFKMSKFQKTVIERRESPSEKDNRMKSMAMKE